MRLPFILHHFERHATTNCTLFLEFLDLTEKIIAWIFVCFFLVDPFKRCRQTMFRIFNQVNWLHPKRLINSIYGWAFNTLETKRYTRRHWIRWWKKRPNNFINWYQLTIPFDRMLHKKSASIVPFSLDDIQNKFHLCLNNHYCHTISLYLIFEYISLSTQHFSILYAVNISTKFHI